MMGDGKAKRTKKNQKSCPLLQPLGMPFEVHIDLITSMEEGGRALHLHPAIEP
jgi:hypothetical protein